MPYLFLDKIFCRYRSQQDNINTAVSILMAGIIISASLIFSSGSVTGASCSVFSGVGNQAACEANVGCTYPGNAGACSAYNSDQSTCSITSGCSFIDATANTCSGFSDTASCNGSAGCSAATDNLCGALSDGGGDGSACATQTECLYDPFGGTCSGNYFSACNGDNSSPAHCDGNYDDGTCAGTYDGDPPTLSSATINGATLTLTYNEALDAGSVPAYTGCFSSSVNGSGGTLNSTNVTGSTVVLTLDTAVVYGDVVTISYPGCTPPIQDAIGNDAASFSGYSVTNNTPDVTAPTLSSASINANVVTLVYNENVVLNSASSVNINKNSSPFSSVSSTGGSGTTVTLTLAHSVVYGDSVTIDYDGTSFVRDTSGNYTGALTGQNVTNNTPDSTSPTVAMSYPTDGLTISGTITASSTASDNVGVAGVKFYIGNTLIGSEDTTSQYSVSFDTTSTSSGTYTFKSVARDSAGNIATSTSITVTIDNTGPTFSSVASSTTATTAIITWSTNEAATSTLNYGTTASYGTATSSQTATTSHRYTLTGLTDSTTYHFQLVGTDSLGNRATSSDYTFTTTDGTGPVISSISSGDPGETTATITWTTDESASSSVHYGLTSSYGSTSTSDTLTTSHSRALTGLTAGTTYHFQVASSDALGNTSTSSDQTFVTDSVAVVEEEQEESGGSSGSRSSTRRAQLLQTVGNITSNLTDTVSNTFSDVFNDLITPKPIEYNSKPEETYTDSNNEYSTSSDYIYSDDEEKPEFSDYQNENEDTEIQESSNAFIEIVNIVKDTAKSLFKRVLGWLGF